MGALMIIIRSWRSARTTGREQAPSTAATPLPAVPNAPVVAPAPPAALANRHPRAERPRLSRPRRYRSDSVLGLRWIA